VANTGVQGKVVYYKDTNNGKNEPDGVKGLKVIAVDYDPIYAEDILGSDTTKSDGSFEITYNHDKYRDWYERNPDIVVRVYGPSSRLLFETPEKKDVTKETLELDPIVIHENNVGNKERGEPWLVTYATLDPKNGKPVWLTQDNQIEPLIDGARVFSKLTEAIDRAEDSIHFMNWKFKAKDAPAYEFGKTIKTKDEQGETVERKKSKKIQELLKEKAEIMEVKVVVWDVNAEIFTGILAILSSLGLLTIGILTGNLIYAFLAFPVLPLGLLGRSLGDTADDVADYFKGSKVETAGLKSVQSLMHARAVIIDGKEAFVMGCSIDQKSYNDSQHKIDDPNHGGVLWHDSGLRLQGSAVEHIDRTVAMIWNAANQLGTSEASAPAPVKNKMIPSRGTFTIDDKDPPQSQPTGVQVIRTLPGDTYNGSHTTDEPDSVPKVTPGKEGKGIPYGETGPLEAYQRSIARAKKFIYIEDQYLTSPDIVRALIQRMTDPEADKLELIIVLNLEPDHPDYISIQKKYLMQLKAEIDNDRLGIFTLWSCHKGNSKYEIQPIYVHSKVGIVDDEWATLGSANLDGASLNQIQTVTTRDHYLPSLKKLIFAYGLIPNFLTKWVLILASVLKLILTIGEIFVYRRPTQHANPNRSTHPSRFTDLNLVLYNNIAGQPKSDAVITLRNQLWREHLGFLINSPQEDDYQTTRPPKGWVDHWKNRAKEKLILIKNKEAGGNMPLILEWRPEGDPEKYLQGLLDELKDELGDKLRIKIEDYSIIENDIS